MDKQTKIMWEAEFVKQYPKPNYEILGMRELIEVNRILFEFDFPEVMEILNKPIDYDSPWEWFNANNTYKRNVEETIEIHSLLYRQERDMKPWNDWKSECCDRFDSIFSASPVYALEELRKGNLLIEG